MPEDNVKTGMCSSWPVHRRLEEKSPADRGCRLCQRGCPRPQTYSQKQWLLFGLRRAWRLSQAADKGAARNSGYCALGCAGAAP